jgi:hypothetical protein
MGLTRDSRHGGAVNGVEEPMVTQVLDDAEWLPVSSLATRRWLGGVGSGGPLTISLARDYPKQRA